MLLSLPVSFSKVAKDRFIPVSSSDISSSRSSEMKVFHFTSMLTADSIIDLTTEFNNTVCL